MFDYAHLFYEFVIRNGPKVRYRGRVMSEFEADFLESTQHGNIEQFKDRVIYWSDGHSRSMDELPEGAVPL